MQTPETQLIHDRLAVVAERLQAASGGAALCRIDGRREQVKELEGRMAALSECRRALRKDPNTDLHAIHERWQADLTARRESGSSQAWLDYLTGGLAELALIMRVRDESPARDVTGRDPTRA